MLPLLTNKLTLGVASICGITVLLTISQGGEKCIGRWKTLVAVKKQHDVHHSGNYGPLLSQGFYEHSFAPMSFFFFLSLIQFHYHVLLNVCYFFTQWNHRDIRFFFPFLWVLQINSNAFRCVWGLCGASLFFLGDRQKRDREKDRECWTWLHCFRAASNNGSFFFLHNSDPRSLWIILQPFDWSSRCVPLVYEASKPCYRISNAGRALGDVSLLRNSYFKTQDIKHITNTYWLFDKRDNAEWLGHRINSQLKRETGSAPVYTVQPYMSKLGAQRNYIQHVHVKHDNERGTKKTWS